MNMTRSTLSNLQKDVNCLKVNYLEKQSGAFVEVVDRKETFMKKVELMSDDEDYDYTEYQYSQLSRTDFARSIYYNR